MKAFTIILFAITSVAFGQDVEKMTATYDHHDDYIYYFKDKENHMVQFEQKEEKAWSKYDLIMGDYEGKKFEVTYRVNTEKNSEGEETYTSTILDLKLLD